MECANFLIEAKAKLNEKDCFGATALIKCFVPKKSYIDAKFDLTVPR